MIDLTITEFLDDSICTLLLERHLHPTGLTRPHGGHPERRLFRAQGYVPAGRCQTCQGYSPLLTEPVFANTRQRPATLVLLRRGIAKGKPTARLAREWGLSRQQLRTLWPRMQANIHATVPTPVMTGTAFEADERYQNAGKTNTLPPAPIDPPRRRANQQEGHGTYAHDRPPSSAYSRARRASSASGAATMPIRAPAPPSSRRTSASPVRGALPMRGRAIRGAIPTMPLAATVFMSGHGRMMVTANARATATPAKEQARRSARTSLRFGAFTNTTYTCTWQRMKPWFIRTASPPS